MNAISPVSQPIRSSEPVASDGPDSASQTPGAGGGDFSKALSDAGRKPPRKQVVAKQHNDAQSGGPLPAPGNQLPLVPPPTPAATAMAAAAQPTSGGAPVASAPVSVAGSVAGAASGSDAPATNAPPKVPDLTDMAAALAAAALDAATPADAAAPAAPTGSLPVETHAVPAEPTSADIGTTIPFASPQTSDAKPVDTRASKADIAAATSGKTSSSGRAAANVPTQGDATIVADSDATAQAAIASAMSRSTGSSAPDSSASADNLATPADITLQGVAAAAGTSPVATVPAAAAAAAHMAAASAAAGSAATAATLTQAMAAAAVGGTADKHHEDSSDSASSGVTNDGSAGAAQLLTSNSPTDGVAAPTFKLAAGVDTPDFGQGLADRVSMMMDSNLTSAKLQVNPPALGPIEVRIALQGGHAQVWLSSHSAVTRDALESSSPRLREMLGSQGFGQVSVDISQRSFQERSPQPQAYHALPAVGGVSNDPQASLAMRHIPSGLLDAYA